MEAFNSDSMVKQRRLVSSATYFLVFHCGMRIADAEEALEIDTSTIPALARAGDYWGSLCFQGLSGLIDAMERKK